LAASAPAAPAAPTAPTAPAAPAAAAAPALQRTAPKSFDARSIDVHDVYGTVRVDVVPGPVMVQLTARKEVLDRVTMRVENGVLRIKERSGVDGTWDIFRWLGYGDRGHHDRLYVHIRAPKGTPLDVDMVGQLDVGDIEAPVNLDLAATSGTVGNVTRANVQIAGGDHKLRIGRVAGPYKLEIAGGPDVSVGSVSSADVEIAGAGSARIGAVNGGLHATIAGSGNVTAASVRGQLRVEIAGSGDVKVVAGVADPLKLSIMGSGDFDFGGEAVNPHVEVLGSGKVRIKSYRGHLTTEGTSDIIIGTRS
jgi:Putative auto-transporter adhesin, head GIN domain